MQFAGTGPVTGQEGAFLAACSLRLQGLQAGFWAAAAWMPQSLQVGFLATGPALNVFSLQVIKRTAGRSLLLLPRAAAEFFFDSTQATQRKGCRDLPRGGLLGSLQLGRYRDCT